MSISTSKTKWLSMLLAAALLLTMMAVPSKTYAANEVSVVRNGGFEESVAGKVIPGWSELVAPTPGKEVSYEVTDEKAYTGDHSLKIIDKAGDGGVTLWSDKLEIVPGNEYTGSVWMFLSNQAVNGSPNRGSFIMRFYNEGGTQVGGDVALVHHTGVNKWTKVSAKATAPLSAKYVRVIASLSNFYVTDGAYYDDFNIEGVFPETAAVSSLEINAASQAFAEQDYTVTLAANGADDLYMINTQLRYNADHFQFVAVEAASSFKGTGDVLLIPDTATPGIVKVVATKIGNESVSGDVDLLVFKFKPLSQQSSSTITIAGQTTTAKISADETQQVFTLGADVAFTVAILANIADVNSDGVINLIDLTIVAQKVGSAVTAETDKYDLNKDGAIDIADVAVISALILESGV